MSEGGKSSAEVEKLRRKLGMENEELQIALEEAEAALEQEEGKFLKVRHQSVFTIGASHSDISVVNFRQLILRIRSVFNTISIPFHMKDNAMLTFICVKWSQRYGRFMDLKTMLCSYIGMSTQFCVCV